MLKDGDNLGRYRIAHLIGSGGMGEVYAADDTELQRRVAIKVFTRELPDGVGARDHLLHEARAASALSHPNVCTVFEVGEDDGRPYIVMELVEGRTLDALIATRDLPAERIVRYGAQIADAIAHAHEHGVVHRDLKSANVVITHDGRAKVLDFGLASTSAGGTDAVTRDVTSAEIGGVSGTLPYMGPEVLRGQAADGRSDIWSLGVLLFEAAAGRLPFTGDTAFEVSTAIMKDSVEIPAETSPGLRSVIQRCLNKAPGERYQSAAEVRAALEMLQSGAASSAEAVSSEVAAAARAATMPRWLPFAAPFSLVAVIALAGWVIFGPRSERSADDNVDRGAPAATDAALGASGRPTIAVLPFRDRTGTAEMAWLAEGVPSMLLTSLAQTPGLDVVSNSRVQEIVERLGVESLQGLDAGALAEFAARSGAGAVVIGDLYYTGTEYRFDVQVEDVDGGRILNAYSATGSFVFPLVDELSESIRAGLQLDEPPAATALAEVTTDSLEAWRRYDEGMTAGANLRNGDAARAFEAAIEADPNFVMAHYQLARLPTVIDSAAVRRYDEYVLANIDRVPERDRLLVEGVYAATHDEDFERATTLLEELVSRYPDHENGWLRLVNYMNPNLATTDDQIETLLRGIAAIPTSGPLHNQLGYSLADRGRYTEAVRAIERYTELHPEEPNGYDSLAEMYILSGQPEVAFDLYGAVLELDPEWAPAYYGRATTAGMLGRYEVALEEIEKYEEMWIAASRGAPGVYSLARAMFLSRMGRYDEALQVVRAGRDDFASAQVRVLQKSAELFGFSIAFEAGDLGAARAFVEQAADGAEEVEDPAARRGVLNAVVTFQGIIDVRSGNLESAEIALDGARRDAEEVPALFDSVEILAGELALATGDLETAAQMFRGAEPELKAFYSSSLAPPTILANNNVFRDGVARAQAASGDLEAAIRSYRDLTTIDIASKYNAFLDPRYILRLAELLDETGQSDEARQQYLRFAQLWADADAQFQPVVERARARAAQLGG